MLENSEDFNFSVFGMDHNSEQYSHNRWKNIGYFPSIFIIVTLYDQTITIHNGFLIVRKIAKIVKSYEKQLESI